MYLTRLMAPWTWRDRGARFAAFARAELSSRYDLLEAANLTADPARAAQLLQHAADEARHARLFHSRARELGQTAPLRADTEHLYETLGEARFFAFVHQGEARACEQFDVWIRHLEPGRDRAALEAVRPDEERHRAYSIALAAPASSIAAFRARRAWMRAGQPMAGAVYRALATVLYLLLAPLAYAVRR